METPGVLVSVAGTIAYFKTAPWVPILSGLKLSCQALKHSLVPHVTFV